MIHRWRPRKFSGHQMYGFGGLTNFIQTFITAPTVTVEPEVEEVVSGASLTEREFRLREKRQLEEQRRRLRMIALDDDEVLSLII